MTVSLPATAVLRISRGSFDPGRFAEVDAASRRVADYLVPAIKQLPGLISYYAGTSADGSTVHASIWDSDEHAAQMEARLRLGACTTARQRGSRRLWKHSACPPADHRGHGALVTGSGRPGRSARVPRRDSPGPGNLRRRADRRRRVMAAHPRPFSGGILPEPELGPASHAAETTRRGPGPGHPSPRRTRYIPAAPPGGHVRDHSHGNELRPRRRGCRSPRCGVRGAGGGDAVDEPGDEPGKRGWLLRRHQVAAAGQGLGADVGEHRGQPLHGLGGQRGKPGAVGAEHDQRRLGDPGRLAGAEHPFLKGGNFVGEEESRFRPGRVQAAGPSWPAGAGRWTGRTVGGFIQDGS